MDETAGLLLFGVAVIGLMVLLQALCFFLPAIVQLLFGYSSKSDYWKQHPGLWKLWIRYRFRIAWSHFAGAMWKERNDDEFITYKFKEELEKTVNASVGNTRVDWEEQQKLYLAIDTTKSLWEVWKARKREMTGLLNGRGPLFAWEKPDPALEGKTELNLPKTLFVASDTSSDLPGDNISSSTKTLKMSSPGVLTMYSGHITYSAHSIGHNSGLREFDSPVSFEELPGLISNSKDPKASSYIGMTKDNWRSFVEDPVLQPPVPPYPLLWFGHYRQEPDDKNEPIAWYVLDIMDRHALLLSKFCLDCKPWHLCGTAANPLTKYELNNLPPVAWQDSSLRAWLNNEFAANAFSRKELHGIRSQDSTGNRITLPTKEEMKHYFPQDNLRAAKPTPYAVTQGAFVYPFSDSAPEYREHVGNTLYWLRDLFKKREKSDWKGDDGIVSVYWDGSLAVYSYDFDKVAVRPSLWLDLESAFGKRHARTLIDAWEREKNTFNRHIDVDQDSQQ